MHDQASFWWIIFMYGLGLLIGGVGMWFILSGWYKRKMQKFQAEQQAKVYEFYQNAPRYPRRQNWTN